MGKSNSIAFIFDVCVLIKYNQEQLIFNNYCWHVYKLNNTTLNRKYIYTTNR